VSEDSVAKATWVAAVAAWVAAIANVFLVVYVVLQLSFAKAEYLDYSKARKVEKMDAMHELFNSPRMLAARHGACVSYPKGSASLVVVFSFFEKLALAEEMAIVSVGDIEYYFGDTAVFYWSAWNDWVRQMRTDAREDPGSSSIWGGYQRIVRRLTKAKGGALLTKAEIEVMLAAEKARYSELQGSTESSRGSSGEAARREARTPSPSAVTR
jgi:hypothetical protein